MKAQQVIARHAGHALKSNVGLHHFHAATWPLGLDRNTGINLPVLHILGPCVFTLKTDFEFERVPI
uniref:Uncharacterized protein n=1 Tax=Pandoraea faecigallinarum TaxID=656179 RepID=A0A173GZM2_9BURK